MNSLIYVWKRSAVNTLKKLIRKPAFWVYLLILGFYAFIMYHSILEELMKRGRNRPETLVAAVSALILYLSPLSYSAYAKRQGMLFRNSDVHFIFPSPVSPKLCLLYGQAKTLLPGLCVELLAAIGDAVVSDPSAENACLLYCDRRDRNGYGGGSGDLPVWE